MLVEPPNVLLGGKMRHFKKIDWPISLSLLFACVLTVIAACVEPSGPLDAPHVVEGGGGTTIASVQITLAQSTLTPGKTTQATVVAKSADGKVVDGRVDFMSQNLSIATVSSNGVVTAVAAGIAVIQATVAGHGATAPVTVQSIVFPVAAVAVAIDSTRISVGHVAQASAVVKDTAGNPITGQTVTWSSLTPNVASVSSSGTVTAIAAGTASIEATASGINGSASIIVEAPPSVAPSVASVAVAFDSTRISVGHATQASAVVKDATGSIMAGQAITWSSLTPGIASVSSSGVVTAIAAGTASIRATASAINGSASIIVEAPQSLAPAVAAVAVAFDSTRISVGHVAQASAVVKDAAGNTITGQAITWSSLTPNIASVSSSGVVTAITAGTASIQATASGINGSASITVGPPPVAVVIVTVDSTTLSIGHTAQASATAKDSAGNPINGQTILWTSLSPSIASVSSSGRVTALAIGIAVIQATISGCSGSSTGVTVTDSAPSTPDLTIFEAPDLASQNFDGGSYSPYYNFWDPAVGGNGDVDIVDDPTGAGRGKVARFHYAGANGDKNRFLQFTHRIGFDSTIYSRGEFYLDVADLGSGLWGRKLIYYRPYQSSQKYGGAWREFAVVVDLQGSQLRVTSWYVKADGSAPEVSAYLPVNLLPKTWYTLETQLTPEASIGAGNGIFRVWLNGALVYETTNLHLSDPAWIGIPIPGGDSTPYDLADCYLAYVYVGDQVNLNNGSFDEYRYWDRVAFSTKRIGQ
ncbi:MAG: Ig-like domain-containing protein [Gemmatimonadota bacterium]|nr:Ig-like domain-containing protein [Gemmatimonadota bacterium]